MKLLLRKDQKTGLVGITTFLLYARVELNDDEIALIDRCNLANEIIAYHEKEKPTGEAINALWNALENQKLTVGKMITGYEFKCQNLFELLEIEQQIKDSALNLQRYLEAANTFGNEEVFDMEDMLYEQE